MADTDCHVRAHPADAGTGPAGRLLYAAGSMAEQHDTHAAQPIATPTPTPTPTAAPLRPSVGFVVGASDLVALP
jgi:hypothetical protein